MNRTLCAVTAVIIIAIIVILDVFIITSYSPPIFLTMGDRILLCAIWSVLLGFMAYCVWDCRAL